MKHLVALFVALAVVALQPSPAGAAAVECRGGTLPPGTYRNLSLDDGCRLDERHVVRGYLLLSGFAEAHGTRVHGDLVLYDAYVSGVHVSGSAFFLGGFGAGISDSRVAGDIWSAGADYSSIGATGNTVGGSIIFDSAGGDGVTVARNVVAEDVTVTLPGGSLSIDDNRIGGHLRLTHGVIYNPNGSVRRNHVAGHLEVTRNDNPNFGNAPPELAPTTVVADNVVEGHMGVFLNRAFIVQGNRVEGVLLCQDNERFSASSNEARRLLGQCDPSRR